MATSSLGPVSAGVFAALNVPALTSLVTGGISDSLDQSGAFPRIGFEVEERETRGLGSVGFPEVTLSVHIFSQHEGGKETNAIASAVMALLRDQRITIAGYTQAGAIFWDETISLGEQEIASKRCRETVMRFRIYAEEA